ncbi:MAG TPA: ATP-binding protein [Enhygromyxa sp.]|nr:ATP-binding protein [Enhygromyxa sp.]
MPKHIQAKTSTEAFWTLDPFVVVEPGDRWFVDLETLLPRDHYGVLHRLQRHLGPSRTRPEFVHVALVGHAGTGKSTLARHALASLADELAPVTIDSLQAFDQADFACADLLLVAAEAVIGQLVELEVDLGRAELEVLRQWLVDELVSESHRTALLGGVEGALDGEVSAVIVARIAAKITAALKVDHEYRKAIRSRAERDPRELIRRVNLLFDAVNAALEPRKLCLVFDNLEKLRLELVDRALLQRAHELRQLHCNMLLFCGPAAELSPIGAPLGKLFVSVMVPALPVRHPGDAPYVVRPEAVDAIEQLLSRRVALEEVFEQPSACVQALAHWSGGQLGDLLQIARRAVENVEPRKVGVEDIEQAARWLGARLTAALRPEDLPRAVELHRTHRVFGTSHDRRMLESSCLLQYDGTQWWDVHPAVRADALFLQAQREGG